MHMYVCVRVCMWQQVPKILHPPPSTHATHPAPQATNATHSKPEHIHAALSNQSPRRPRLPVTTPPVHPPNKNSKPRTPGLPPSPSLLQPPGSSTPGVPLCRKPPPRQHRRPHLALRHLEQQQRPPRLLELRPRRQPCRRCKDWKRYTFNVHVLNKVKDKRE